MDNKNNKIKKIFKYLFCLSGAGPFIRKMRGYYYMCIDFLAGTLFPEDKVPAGFVPGSILLVRIDRVGDLVVSIPAIHAVRKRFPDARIDVLVSEYACELISSDPHIDNVLIYGRDRLPDNYDAAVGLHPGIRVNRLVYESGARMRVGFSGWGGSFYLTDVLVDDRQKRPRHEVQTALEAVGRIGCGMEENDMRIYTDPAGERNAEHFLRDKGLTVKSFVILHPGARQRHVRWDGEKFARVADKIAEEFGYAVVITGSESERALVEDVASRMRCNSVTAAGLPLAVIVSLYSRSVLFVGNITGPMHIACALKIPVVAVSGVWGCLDDYRYWGPWKTENRVVNRKDICQKCHPSDCHGYKCMDSISVEDVYMSVKELLNRVKGEI